MPRWLMDCFVASSRNDGSCYSITRSLNPRIRHEALLIISEYPVSGCADKIIDGVRERLCTARTPHPAPTPADGSARQRASDLKLAMPPLNRRHVFGVFRVDAERQWRRVPLAGLWIRRLVNDKRLAYTRRRLKRIQRGRTRRRRHGRITSSGPCVHSASYLDRFFLTLEFVLFPRDQAEGGFDRKAIFSTHCQQPSISTTARSGSWTSRERLDPQIRRQDRRPSI